jgi:hypothetical protein
LICGRTGRRCDAMIDDDHRIVWVSQYATGEDRETALAVCVALVCEQNPHHPPISVALESGKARNRFSDPSFEADKRVWRLSACTDDMIDRGFRHACKPAYYRVNQLLLTVFFRNSLQGEARDTAIVEAVAAACRGEGWNGRGWVAPNLNFEFHANRLALPSLSRPTAPSRRPRKGVRRRCGSRPKFIGARSKSAVRQ